MILDILGSMVAMVTMDRQGRVVYATKRWSEMTGWPLPDIRGLHWSVYVHPDDLADARRAGREAVDAASSVSYESRVVSCDGASVTWVRSRVAPIAVKGGAPNGWLLVADDLTERQQAHDALQLSEERLRVIFNRLPDVLTILEADGSWRSSSVSTAWGFDLDSDELASTGWWEVVHPDDRDDARRALASLVAGSAKSPGLLHEVRLVGPGGESRWVETAGVNLVDEPSVRGIVLHSRDVTERRRAENALRSANARLSGLIAAMHLGVHVTDEQGTVIAVNRAFINLLGIGGSPEDMVGSRSEHHRRRFQHIWADPAEATARLASIIDGGRLHVDARFVLSDGRTIGTDFVPIQDHGVHLGHMWLIRDVTDEEALAAEREYLLEMERQQNVRLTELDTLKTELLASVSHEIRTPLTSIASFTQLLSDGLGIDGVADQEEHLSVIARNVDRLQRMVEDLLFLDRAVLNAVPAELELVDVGALVAMAVSSIRLVAEEEGVSVTADVAQGPPLRGDGQRIGQLVDNLLANAVRFTPPGGCVGVKALPVERGWRLDVTDSGIGIPEEEQGRVFERFYRASNARREVATGSGLGLAIVQRVAEFHNGTVAVRSAPGRGSTFTVELHGVDEAGTRLSPLTGMIPPARRT
ncbi:MAG: sensor histidine kinase [Acidimicrobiales bacterium]